MTEIIEKGEPKLVPLSQLFLDPNNYRFIDNENYTNVDRESIVDSRIQKRTVGFIKGKGTEGISDLIKSFRKNGFLHVDQVQVENLGENRYRVLEGNRRVTALKHLWELYQDGIDIGNLNPEIFQAVPVIVYQPDSEVSHQIVMGLKHINGNKKWPPLNQAKLIRDLIQLNDLTVDDVSEALGIGKVKIRKSLRALDLIDLYKTSDYGDQFETKMYAVFEETVNKPSIRSWFDWDADEDKPTNTANLQRFFSWISTEFVDEQEDHDNISEIGEELEAIITKSAEIRDLADFIDDEQAVSTMEKTRSVSQALLLSDVVGKNKLEDSLSIIDSQIQIAKRFAVHASESELSTVYSLRQRMDSILEQRGMAGIQSETAIPRQVFVSFDNSHFKEVTFKSYKKLHNVRLEQLSRINVIVGQNNSGKTTVLEGINLLLKQNDVFAYMEAVRRRNKLKEFNSSWFDKYLRHVDYEIEGIYDGKSTKTHLYTEIEEDVEYERNSYLRTINIESNFQGANSESRYLLFEGKDGQARFKRLNNICESRFSSPYSTQNQKDINDVYQKTVEENSISDIIAFMQEHVDSGIKDINYVDEKIMGRFLVDHKNFEEAMDLTSFGEGIQRVFYIALHFAACRNGVLLIDEFDNAIHYSLLIEFTKFIQLLSIRFNTQVFLTTHSKECVDSFVQNNFNNEQIRYFSLQLDNETKRVASFDGVGFQNVLRVMNTDLR